MARSNLKVLFVDDSPSIIAVFGEALRKEVKKVDTAMKGEEALERLRKERYDILFLDWFLPDMTGLEVLKKIKEENIDVTTIMITGKSAPEMAQQAKREGAYDYIEKPENLEGIESVIARSLKRYKAQK